MLGHRLERQHRKGFIQGHSEGSQVATSEPDAASNPEWRCTPTKLAQPAGLEIRVSDTGTRHALVSMTSCGAGSARPRVVSRFGG
jgi:hypothetical protein